MHLNKLGICCGILIASVSSAAFADGDAAKGGEIARESCVQCHNVEPGGPFQEQPPSFASIAVYRTDDQIYGRISYPPLHSVMPVIGYLLTPENIDNLVAYIRSLEARQDSP